MNNVIGAGIIFAILTVTGSISQEPVAVIICGIIASACGIVSLASGR